jgi:hypothetical protein
LRFIEPIVPQLQGSSQRFEEARATDDRLEAAGYKNTGEKRTCSGRRYAAIIEAWTSKKGQPILLHRSPDGLTLRPHYAVCPDACFFKR